MHWTVPGEDDEDDKALDFYFKSVEMRDKTPEEILRLDHLELLPLLPATQGGTSREVIELMMKRLQASGDTDLPYYGYLVSGRIMKFLGQQDELLWLQERYKTMDEKFRSSPVYQWTLDEGIAIGEERGKAEGIALGKSQTQAQTLAQMRKRVMEIVVERFLSLAGLAGEIIAMINNPDPLLDLIVKLAPAQSTKEAEQILLQAQAAG